MSARHSKKCGTVTAETVVPKVNEGDGGIEEVQNVAVVYDVPSKTETKIKLSLIKDADLNREPGNIEGLMESIKSCDLINPITVTPISNHSSGTQYYKMRAGRRRYQVFKRLGREEIPCRILNSKGDLFDLKVEIDENLHHKPYTDLEVATKIKEYDELKRQQEGNADKTRALYKGKVRKSQCDQRDEGWSNAKTAKDLGISKSSVTKAKKIATAAEEHPELAKLDKGNQVLKGLKKIEARKKRKIEIPKGVTPPIIKLGDFQDLIKELPDNSVDLVLTDPPYLKECLPLWEPLAKESVRVLKPGGFLVTYSGHYYLPEVINALLKHLSYYWTCALIHKGRLGSVPERRMRAGFKPILIFYKPPIKHPEHLFTDTITGDKPDKDFHEWGQGCDAVIKLMKHFSKPGDTILDPMMGGGMTIEAAMKTERNVIGYEIKKEYYDLVKERLENAAAIKEE